VYFSASASSNKKENFENIVYGTEGALKKISVMHVIKLGFAPVSFPPG
jgi:hypothetical protein